MTLTDEQLAEIAKRPDFLLEAARYFRNRPTNGEDRAHWSNVYNAENCEKSATDIRALLDGIERLRGVLNTVLVGGNHLALMIGADHLPHTVGFNDALEHYGAGDRYEIWCCWKTMMEARP